MDEKHFVSVLVPQEDSQSFTSLPPWPFNSAPTFGQDLIRKL
jgi:hypothetical protein